MTATGPTARPTVRLLWDEDLSPSVPQALRLLGFNTSYVGAEVDRAPKRGATDAEVVRHALLTNQIIVTKNHDMMTLCHETGQRFVWLDPRGRTLFREQQVLLVLSQIRRWQEILAEDPTSCVRALRTKCAPIDSADAARLARQRMRSLERRRRAKVRRLKAEGPLVAETAASGGSGADPQDS